MGHSRAEKAESRDRILKIAAKTIREHGVDSLSIGSLMKAANLTHGGFYGHFKSRDELVRKALEEAVNDTDNLFDGLPSGGAEIQLDAVLRRYLSRGHRNDAGSSCPVASLATDVARIDDAETRTVMKNRIRENIARMSSLLGDDVEGREVAISAWSTMVGSLILARVFRGEDISDDILRVGQETVLGLTANDR